jgi:hypothetical protein
MNTAVLFLIFNRPHTTAEVFAAIREARPERLYVGADGPRADREGEAERCAEARRIATDADWPCEVRTLFRNDNLGCRRAVNGAITWFFEHEEEGIILEDDCLPHPSFFPYCAALLERYREDPQIMCITGNNFQADMRGWPYSYYYSIFNHCWGWASWRRAWALYDAELEAFDPATAPRMLNKLCPVRGFGAHWSRILNRVKAGGVDSWAYIWTWSCFRQRGLTCTPKVNLVSNIGFGDAGTHTKTGTSPLANMPTRELEHPLKSPPEKQPEQSFDQHVALSHFGIGGPTLLKQVRRKIKRLAKFSQTKGRLA